MDAVNGQCPKCGHQQQEAVECAACGLIFAKYQLRQQAKGGERGPIETGEPRPKPFKPFGRLVQVAVLVMASSSLTWYLSRSPEPQVTQPPPAVAETAKGENVPPPALPAGPPPTSSAGPVAPGKSTASPIERARLATVSIETPWGSGSGFFVSENYIVTNRHVVELDQEHVAAFRREVETKRRLADLEKDKIAEMQRSRARQGDGPNRRQLDIIIAEHQRQLAKFLPQLEEAEGRLAKLEEKIQPGDIKIIMADGSEHTASYLVTSPNQDLALLTLFARTQAFIPRPPANSGIEQGDKVYTVGSPAGLRQTVTAGIFSGLRKRETDGALFLQTDAPINPGNSGGPLIDEQGYARGVNTMILRDTEGIGFAIPIETVFSEFRSTLY